MPIEIHPLLPTSSDTGGLVRIHYRAFAPTVGTSFFHSPPSDESYELMAAERARVISQPHTRAFKAVDADSGTMVGSAIFRVLPSGTREQKLNGNTPIFERFAPELNAEAWIALGRRLEECYAQTVGTQPCLEVTMLVVDPAWQRKGIAGRLLEWGCQEADRLGCIDYVASSNAGIRTYEKAGFKKVATIDFDASPWGVVGKFEVDTIMIRQPNPIQTGSCAKLDA